MSCTSFTLTAVPALQSLFIGQGCFLGKLDVFKLYHLPALSTLSLGRLAFARCKKMVVEDVPMLKVIHLGFLTLMHCKKITWKHPNGMLNDGDDENR